MTVWQELLLFSVGVAAGYINVMAGGGSLLTVPAMLFMGLPAPIANGTNRIAILMQSLTSCWVFARKSLSQYKLSCSLALCALPGAYLGAKLGVDLQGVWFNRLIAAIMLMVMLCMAYDKKPSQNASLSTQKPRRLVLTHILMLLVGFYGGLIQVGVGFIIMPLLHRVMGLDLITVNVHKVFIVLPFTLLSLIIFVSEVGVYWAAGLFLAAGNALGGWLGAHSMLAQGERLIKIVFNITLAVLILKLILIDS